MITRKLHRYLCAALLAGTMSTVALATITTDGWVSLSSDSPDVVRAVISSEVEKVTGYSTIEEGESKNRALLDEKEREDAATKAAISDLTTRFIQAKRVRDSISSRFAEKTNEVDDYRKNVHTLTMQIQNLDSQNERYEKEIATQQEHLKKTLRTEKQGEALTAVIHIQGIRDKLYDLNRRADELSGPELAHLMGASIQSYTEVVGGVLSQDFIRSVVEGTAKPVNEEPVRIQLDVTSSGTKYLRVKRYELYPFQDSGETKKTVTETGEKEHVVIINSIADLERLLSRNGYQIARYDTSRIRKLIDEVDQANRLQNEALKETIATIQERITNQRGKIAEAGGDRERDEAKRARLEETLKRLTAELAAQKIVKEKAELDLAAVESLLSEKKRVSETIILKFALQASKGGQSPAEASIEAIIDKLDEVKNEARIQHSRESVEINASQLTGLEQEQQATEARVTAVRLIAFTNEGSNGVRVRVAFRVRTVLSEVEQAPAAQSPRPEPQPVSRPQKLEPKKKVDADTGRSKAKKGKKVPAKPVKPNAALVLPADEPPTPDLPSDTSGTVPLPSYQPDANKAVDGSPQFLTPVASLMQHTKDIETVAFSSDGSRAASGDRNNTVIVWETRTWTPVATLIGHRNNVQALAFDPKGQRLASGSDDKSVIIWNLATQVPLTTIPVDKSVSSLSYNPSGTHLAVGVKADESGIWDVKTGVRSRLLRTGSDVLTLAYSPGGKLVATGGKDKKVQLWNPVDGGEARILYGHRGDITALSFTPDSRQLLTASEDKSISVWNVEDLTLQKKLEGHQEEIVAIAVSRDGRRVISADSQRSGGTIIIWDLKNGTISKRIKTQQKIKCMSLSPDGRHLLVGSDRALLVYRLE